MLNVLLRWLFFGVALSFFPILAAEFALLMKGKPATLAAVLGDGALFIIAAGVAGGGAGEVLVDREHFKSLRTVSAGCCLILLAMSCVCYGCVAYATPVPVPGVVVEWSVWILLGSIIAAASSRVLSRI